MATKIEAIHPGEILFEEFMKPRGLTANGLALDLRVPANRLSEIIRGRRSISADTALRLARYFETSAELWLGLQVEYDLRKAKADIGKQVDREVRVAAG